MRVIFQITNGPQNGRKVLLGPERELKVGRSEWAELVCEDDIKMSRVHFKIETNAYGCSIEDAGSSNGTFINEERIAQKTVVTTGDLVRAGETVFVVEIEGDSPREAETINTQELAAVAALKESRESEQISAERAAVLTGEKVIGYSVAEIDNGLAVFTPAEPPGQQAAVVAARVASLLSETAPLFVLLSPLSVPDLAPEELAGGEPILNYMPEEVVRQRSPLLIPSDAIHDLPDLFEKAWGNNALICFVALAGFEELLEQIRTATRSDAKEEGLVGICWPNVLSGLLTAGDKQLFEKKLPDVQAVLLEDAEHDNAWKLIAEPGFADLLSGIGLKEAKQAAR